MPGSLRKDRIREIGDAYLLIAPAIIGFAVFVIGPMIASVGLSFADWHLLTPDTRRFVGFRNFISLFGGYDRRQFATVYENTMIFVVAQIALFIVVGLFVAFLLNHRFPPALLYFIRLGYFLPFVTATGIVAGVWTFLFNTDLGIINYYLGLLGIPKIPWLNSAVWAKVAVIVFGVWKHFGFYTLVFLAGLQNIPRYLYEVAEIDGASTFRKLINITIPMLSPTIFFLMVIGFINTIQIFDTPYVLTRGRPGDATRTVVMYIYQQAFENFELGTACAVAVTLFVIILLATGIQFKAQKRWVHYE